MSKRFLSILLAAVMLLALAACGAPAPAAAAPTEAPAAQTATQAPAAATQAPQATIVNTPAPEEKPEELPMSDVDLQLALIYSQIDTLVQKGGELPWFYTVTDLDHNGNLEFIAAAQHPQDRSTNLRIWEVGADRKTLVECVVEKDPEESFPDIMTDNADTYHDVAADTWYYLFYDNVVLSPTEVYTSKSAFTLKEKVISYEAYAVEHAVVENAVRVVSHTDAQGNPITPALYNAAGNTAFAGTERSATGFEWLTAEDARSLSRLTDSIAVFNGLRKASENFPVPQPAALQHPEVTPSPTPSPSPSASPTPAPTAAPVYLTITKNPTNENNRTIGGQANFVACANAFESLAWTMVDPSGNLYTPQQVMNMFGATITGMQSSTLTITVTQNMNGWGAYCTFYYKNQTARTSTAYLYVKDAPAPEPASGVLEGRVVQWNYGSVSLRAEGMSMMASWDVVNLEGDIYEDAPAVIHWKDGPNGRTVTLCTITGRQPAPQPSSMGGTIHHDTASTVFIVFDDGTELHVNGLLVNMVQGSTLDGARCIAYYTGALTAESVYQVDVFGYDPAPQRQSLAADGRAFREVDGRISLHLDSGETAYVDAYSHEGYSISINTASGDVGMAGGGNPCRIFFYDSFTGENVYEVVISEAEDAQPEPEPAVMAAPAAAPVNMVVNGRAFKEPDGTILLTLENGEQCHVEAESREGYTITITTESGDVAMAGEGSAAQIFFYDSFEPYNIYEVHITDE